MYNARQLKTLTQKKNIMPNLKCWLFGHKWNFQKTEIVCSRCPAWLVKRVLFRKSAAYKSHVVIVNQKYGFPDHKATDFSKHTIVPLDTLQVAEAACREVGYNKTAKQLRKCLTAER